MRFEDLEIFYEDFKNGIITLDEWVAICQLGLEDIIKEGKEKNKKIS